MSAQKIAEMIANYGEYPREKVCCIECKGWFTPYPDMENEIIEHFWCVSCVQSNNFLCGIFKDGIETRTANDQ